MTWLLTVTVTLSAVSSKNDLIILGNRKMFEIPFTTAKRAGTLTARGL